MKIDILCNDGSPLGIHHSDIFGNRERVGLGGAELALMTMAEGWTKAGHEVVLYNDPRRPNESPFEQRAIGAFEKDASRDVLIVFRSPNPKAYKANGYKVWWSCDQYTVGDFNHFSQFVEKIVTISPFHNNYFSSTYRIKNTIPIDLPVRIWEYGEVDKIPNRLLFNSVPDRGLDIVAKVYPQIKEAIPGVTLCITSDYRLWGTASPLNDQYVRQFMRMEGVEFVGAIPRTRLIEEELKAQIHFYPCIYEELFCIACAETQVAGALPITTPIGALSTTNMGVVIDGDARTHEAQHQFLLKTLEYLTRPDLCEIQKSLQEKARKRFSLERILSEWDNKIFNA